MRRYKYVFLLAMILILVSGLMSGCKNSPEPQTGNLEVLLQDSNGNPLWGGKVISEKQPEGMLKLTGITGNDGRVIYNDILVGEYEFYINRFDYLHKNFSVVVVAEKTISLTFMLEHDSGTVPTSTTP
jgi:hypothetical protein